jgi:hypothetical protein
MGHSSIQCCPLKQESGICTDSYPTDGDLEFFSKIYLHLC